MPKIADIEYTPNPNAVKFILKEPVTAGSSRSYQNALAAQGDPLAASLFDVGNVTSVFYMDRFITINKADHVDWEEMLRKLAEPIRSAPAVTEVAQAAAAESNPAYVVGENPLLDQINQVLDEKVRSGLAMDGGGLEIIGLNGKRLTISYQGACGSCPSSSYGTLMAIESMLKAEVDPEIEVISV
ncbi:MAG: NifU family protein [Acidobacteria bacterium]|nr:NifU family protein [Acidobacteriota bacterium]MBI3423914.1 NifU family protein [Acidobacteriota bacterium]